MSNQTYIQDYYGRKNVINTDTHNKTTIFIIDDNKLYLNILKGTLKRRGYSVMAFTTGEEALQYISLKPEVIVIDYHLDGINPYAEKGDKISKEMIKESPKSQVIMMSSDKRFRLISKLNLTKKILYKDSNIITKIESNIVLLLSKAHILKTERTSLFLSNLIKIFILATVSFILIYNLIIHL